MAQAGGQIANMLMAAAKARSNIMRQTAMLERELYETRMAALMEMAKKKAEEDALKKVAEKKKKRGMWSGLTEVAGGVLGAIGGAKGGGGWSGAASGFMQGMGGGKNIASSIFPGQEKGGAGATGGGDGGGDAMGKGLEAIASLFSRPTTQQSFVGSSPYGSGQSSAHYANMISSINKPAAAGGVKSGAGAFSSWFSGF